MAYDYSKLKGKITEMFGTQDRFAEALGLSRTSLSQRLNCKLEFNQNEMDTAVKVLGLKQIDIPAYFFTLRVEKTEQNTA